MQKVIIALVVVVLLGGGIYLATKDSGESTDNQQQTPTTSEENAQPQPNERVSDSATGETAMITFDGNGFNPSSLTAAVGTTVTVKNNSSRTIQFDSNPHPQHTDNPELNIETIASGESNTFIANTAGTFGYHNHLNPSETGTLIVE